MFTWEKESREKVKESKAFMSFCEMIERDISKANFGEERDGLAT